MATPYQVIARKWRPQTFDDVVGQDHVVRTLKNAIARNRIAHAYLLVGPRGTGKTSTARIFAKALNATGGPNASFDPLDPICADIAEGRCLDVIEFDAASNTQVDKVREFIIDTVAYAPAQARFKVYIIDEVHMLSAGSFNALLKTLEEPPAHVKFIFATTDPQKMPATVISRCQRFDLKPIPSELIVQRLKKIAVADKIKVSDAALASIARMADGGMRDAQSIFDQMISFCGTEVGEADVLDVYGLVAEGKIAALAAALAVADHKKIIELVDEADENGRDLFRLLVDLQTHVQTALLAAIAQGGTSERLGAPLTTEQLTRLLDGLHEGENGVKHGLSQKINFEVALLKAVEASRARAIDSLIKEIATLAEGLPEGSKKKRLTTPPDDGARDLNGGESGVGPKESDEEDAPIALGVGASTDEMMPTGPSPEEEATLLMAQRGSEEFYGQAPLAENLAPVTAEESLPPLEDLVKRIPPATRDLLEELFRARFVTVKRVPKSALKS